MEDILAIIIIFGVGTLFDRIKKQDGKKQENKNSIKTVKEDKVEPQKQNLNNTAKNLENLKDKLKEKRKEKIKEEENKRIEKVKNISADKEERFKENILEDKLKENKYHKKPDKIFRKSKNISFINKNNIKNAIIMKEILDKPKSLKK